MEKIPTPQNLPISQLMEDINEGRMKLPEMQRPYVWTKQQVLDLFDSLYRGYPIGTILRWQSNNSEVKMRDFALNETNKNKFMESFMLLDGQQRLTSLSAVINGQKIKARSKKNLIDLDIYFNLAGSSELTTEPIDKEDADDEDEDFEEQEAMTKDNGSALFVIGDKQIASNKSYISLSKLYQFSDAYEFLIATGYESNVIGSYYKKLKPLFEIRNMELPVTTLSKKLSYKEVVDIFVRTNSKGTRLTSCDLALAKITSKWTGSLKLFEDFIDNCTEWDLNMDTLLRTLTAILTGKGDFEALDSLSKEELEKGWEHTKNAINSAINYLTKRFNIETGILLTSYHFLVVLAYFVHLNDKKCISNDELNYMYRWILIGSAKGRYGSSADTRLNDDLATIKSGKITQLLELLKQQTPLEITESDLTGAQEKKGYLKLIFILMRYKKLGMDPMTKMPLSVKNKGKKDSIEKHHLFPKNQLKNKWDNNMINDLSNFTFIGKVTNVKITDREPEEYLEEILTISGEKILQEHFIPLDKELWKLENFPRFLSERRKLLVKFINDSLKEIENEK